MFNQSDIGYQKAVQTAMAKMRASGSWKTAVLDKIFETMAEGQAKKDLAAMRIGADRQYREMQDNLNTQRANARLALQRDAFEAGKRDETIGNVISGIGTVAAGYTGYQDYKSKLAQADRDRQLIDLLLRPTATSQASGVEWGLR